MALMRTPVLDGAEAVASGNGECSRLHNEKALAHGEHAGQLRALAEGRTRTRKGKSGQKKQPQRGLGVAQLEKLRMQEQSKQEAACVASLQSLPSFGFPGRNHNGGAYFRHITGVIPRHHYNYGCSSSLPFGNGGLGSPDKLGDYPSREGYQHSGEGSVDEDVFRTLVSLASTDHVSRSRHVGGPSVSVMVSRREDDSERFFVCHNPQAETLGNLVHGSPSSVNNPGTEASPSTRASCELAWEVPSPNSVRKPSFFSSALVSEASLTASHASSVEVGDEKPAVAQAAVDTSKESVPRVLSPGSSKGVVEVGVVNAKFLPAVVNTSAWSPIFTFTDLQCFKSSLGPANLSRLPRDRVSVPVVGVGANCDRPKELSSFQSFLSNQSWSTPEKSCGWKRPWHALHESTCKPMHSESLGLNALAGDIDAPNRFRDSTGVGHGQHIADGAHHSEGIIRSASEDCSPRPLKIRMCGMWDESRSSEGVAVRDMGFFLDESLLKDRCAPGSKPTSRCSSDFPPGSLTLNRRRCLSTPEIPVLTRSEHQKSGDFLTLGLSSFPASSHLEVEADNQEAVIPEERCKSKQADIGSKGTHDILQLQMCGPQQQLVYHSASVTNDVICSEGPRANARPSFRFFPLPSGSVTEHCHKLTGRKKEDFLDLRLKLAL